MAKPILFPAEKVTLFFLVLCLGLYLWFGIALREPWKLYSTRFLHSMIFYLIGLVLLLFGYRLRDLQRQMSNKQIISQRLTWRRYHENFLSWKNFTHDLRLLHCVALMFVVFINLKHLIPVINPKIMDRQFGAWEMTMLSGQTFGELLHYYLGTDAAYVLSPLYTFFYTYVALILYFMIFSKRSAQEFFTVFCLLWFVGVSTVYLCPTWGPVFFLPELYATLPHTDVTELQRRLLEHQQFLAVHPLSDKGVYLISGFPSLHLAVPTLGSLYLWRISRLVAIFSWCFVAATTVTTLYFGWHWIVDDLGSVLLVILVINLKRLLFPALTRDYAMP